MEESPVLPKIIFGVAAMENKARSKPMRKILKRLTTDTTVDFDVIVFGDRVLLEQGTCVAANT
jgi:inositol hexakisphosphate/diphosphoinositol-pentakisphosphate kinase